MVHSYKFCLVQFPAHPMRDERLNLAIAVFHNDHLDIRPTRRFEKLRAISAALDAESVRTSVVGLDQLDGMVRSMGVDEIQGRHHELSQIAPFKLSALGEFFASNANAYELQLDNLLKRLVEPEPALPSPIKCKSTPLLRSVKSIFRSERILAKKGEGLETHRVVSNHLVAEGLSADLILKNGSMHVMQTVDAISEGISSRKVISHIAISALIFEQARMTFIDSDIEAKLIYQASSALEAALTPSLLAAEHQGAALINWDSEDDQRSFIARIAASAEPSIKADKQNSSSTFHASAQHRFNLN